MSMDTGVIPRSLLLRGVTLEEKYASANGAYGDIFRASYRGKPVAMKRIKKYTNRASDLNDGVSGLNIVTPCRANCDIGFPEGGYSFVALGSPKRTDIFRH